MADNVHIDEAEEIAWTKEPYVPSTPGDLPASSNKDFWEDAKVCISDAEKLSQRAKEAITSLDFHQLQLQQGYFVCMSCPFTHTMQLSPRDFTLDKAGKLIPIDKG